MIVQLRHRSIMVEEKWLREVAPGNRTAGQMLGTISSVFAQSAPPCQENAPRLPDTGNNKISCSCRYALILNYAGYQLRLLKAIFIAPQVRL
jgi:hypothetical protein